MPPLLVVVVDFSALVQLWREYSLTSKLRRTVMENEQQEKIAGGIGSGGGKGRKILIYFYPYELTPNDVLSDGPQEVGNPPFKLEGNTMLIWVDLVPEAKFEHPTAYILISAKNTRVEKGGWWPVLNGQRVLYGQNNPISIPSPFELNSESYDIDVLLQTVSRESKIYMVHTVDLVLLKKNPPILKIVAGGVVNSCGWTNPRLIPRVYVQPPPDGIWEFDFVAEPPTGITIPTLSLIDAIYLREGFSYDWKGVRVYSEKNYVEKMFDKVLEITAEGNLI